jgi:FixJ family two-component response regulator
MALEKHVHIVALSSLERAEQARACYAFGFHAEIYGNYEELIAARPFRGLVLAEDIPERGGIAALVAGMSTHGLWLPIIATSVAADARRVVEAVRRGALDYLTLPLDAARLRTALDTAVAEGQARGSAQRQAVNARAKLATLTAREAEVLDLLVAGSSNKTIARELEISPRTVEIHRANMMSKLGAHHAADAVRLRLEASLGEGGTVVSMPARARTG